MPGRRTIERQARYDSTVELTDRQLILARNCALAILWPALFALGYAADGLILGWWGIPIDLIVTYLMAGYFVGWILPPIIEWFERIPQRKTAPSAQASGATHVSRSIALPPAQGALQPGRITASRRSP